MWIGIWTHDLRAAIYRARRGPEVELSVGGGNLSYAGNPSGSTVLLAKHLIAIYERISPDSEILFETVLRGIHMESFLTKSSESPDNELGNQGEAAKLRRATIAEKIEVLDYLHGPPIRSQTEVLAKFKKLNKFAISQATLSTWVIKEDALRKHYKESPYSRAFTRFPRFKYPEITERVESDILLLAEQGIPIKDDLILKRFQFHTEQLHGAEAPSLSSAILKSLRQRVDDKLNSDRPQLSATPPSERTPNFERSELPISNIVLPSSHASDELFSLDSLFDTGVGFSTKLIHSDQNFTSILDNNELQQHGGPIASSNSLNGPVAQPTELPIHNDSHPMQNPLNPSVNLPLNNATKVVDIASSLSNDPNKLKLQQPARSSYVLENFTYSRSAHPNSEKVETILENITEGFVTIYNSGTSAIMGLLTYLNPRQICINNSGYQGTHEVIKLLNKLTGVRKYTLGDFGLLEAGDVMIIESPMNPEGYCLDISMYSNLVHQKGALLLVDSTLAPPPLQNPFQHGADYILHSATKYFSGHSDLLAGFIVCKDKKIKRQLIDQRFSLGTNIANFDSFLLLRSLRTFKMRILQQCYNTEKIIKFLIKNSPRYTIVQKIHHSSQQTSPFLKEQLRNYYNPVFGMEFKSKEYAELILSRFKFINSSVTGGGGIETMVEFTHKSRNFVSPPESAKECITHGNLLRFSIGCEDYQDLIKDLDQAISSLQRSLALRDRTGDETQMLDELLRAKKAKIVASPEIDSIPEW